MTRSAFFIATVVGFLAHTSVAFTVVAPAVTSFRSHAILPLPLRECLSPAFVSTQVDFIGS